jgi:multidrug efflux system membrane fusion protein
LRESGFRDDNDQLHVTDAQPMTRSSRRLLIASAVVVALVGGGVAAYFSTDSGAKEGRKAAKGPPPVSVTVVRVAQETVPVRLNAIGNVEAYQTVAVKARVDGQIDQVNMREGAPVKKGEVLFRIDPRPYEAALRQAEANALRDAAARDQARSQDRRYQELLEKNFVSKEAYAQIRTNAATAEATAKASQAALENARLNLDYCTIRSSLDGYVGRVLLQAGNLVKANDVNPLVVINQVRPIYVNFAVPEQTLPEVRQYMAKGALAVEVIPPDNQPAPPRGRLIFVDNAVDASTGTIRLRAQFDNADAALWPGQFVNVSVRLYEQPDAIVIPSQAVQSGPEGQYAYVIGDDMLAEVRRISVQRTDGDRAIIAKGLAKDERVVTRGQLRLGPKVRVQIGKPAAEPS